jgi:hypothetical protein
MSWGTFEEPFENLIGTHFPLPPSPQPITSKLKRNNNNNNNNNLLAMHVEPSRWLHEIFIFKIICHHFQHKSLGTSSYCVRIESIKSFVSFNFCVHAGMKLGTIIVDDTISQTTWVIQLCLQENFPKVERSFFSFSKNKPPRLNWLII